MKASFHLKSETDSDQFGARLASCITPPLVLGFSGDLGVGKTTLIRAMLRKLGVTDAVKSPTFSLVESYSFARYDVHHFDLYRLSDTMALEAIGFRDYAALDTICCIEWPERIPTLMAYCDVIFLLKIDGPGRFLALESLSPAGENLVNKVCASTE